MYELIAPKEFLGNSLLLQTLNMDMGKDLGLLKAVLDATEKCFDHNNVRCTPTCRTSNKSSLACLLTFNVRLILSLNVNVCRALLSKDFFYRLG